MSRLNKQPPGSKCREEEDQCSSCGHVKPRLTRNEPLEGDLLEFALGTVGENAEIAEKLKAGQQLDGYELHLMEEIYLLNTRLGVYQSTRN